MTDTTGQLMNKITIEYIDSRISSRHYFQPFPGSTMTICQIIIDNGFGVIGESACVDPANFNQRQGEEIAYKKAYEKLWPLFGFMLAEQRKAAGIELKPVDYGLHPHEILGDEPADGGYFNLGDDTYKDLLNTEMADHEAGLEAEITGDIAADHEAEEPERTAEMDADIAASIARMDSDRETEEAITSTLNDVMQPRDNGHHSGVGRGEHEPRVSVHESGIYGEDGQRITDEVETES